MYEKNRKDLVKKLELKGYIKSDVVKQAFLKVPREEFIPENMKDQAYADSPLEIGSGQTISAPHMIAIMCEELFLKPGQKILEIGTGSGYHAAIVADITGKSGHIYSVERHSNLADKAKENLRKVNIKNVTVEIGDGSKGIPKFQPYDRIFVTCAAPDIPQTLVDQLKDPGMLLIPVGSMFCELKRFEKNKGKTSVKNLGGCAFVPLIGEYGH